MNSQDMLMEAHRYWMGLLLFHSVIAKPITTEMIRQHLDDLKNGVPIDHLEQGGPLTPAAWDEENLARYPSYEAVGLELAARIERFRQSGNMHHLTDTD